MKPQQTNTKTKPSNAKKDLVFISFGTISMLILSYYYNFFFFLVRYFQKHPRSITFIDEIITSLFTLSIGLAIFSWRRWIELKKETTQRIKLQEELLQMAKTQAETERIISKQLRSEIEIRKAEELHQQTTAHHKKNHPV